MTIKVRENWARALVRVIREWFRESWDCLWDEPEDEPWFETPEHAAATDLLTLLKAGNPRSPISVQHHNGTLFVNLRGDRINSPGSEIVASGSFRGLTVIVED